MKKDTPTNWLPCWNAFVARWLRLQDTELRREMPWSNDREITTDEALAILRDHGALTAWDFADRLYPDSPRWMRQENVRKAKEILRELQKCGLVARCRRVSLYYVKG